MDKKWLPAWNVRSISKRQKNSTCDKHSHPFRSWKKKIEFLGAFGRIPIDDQTSSGDSSDPDVWRRFIPALFPFSWNWTFGFLASKKNNSSETGGIGWMGVKAKRFDLEMSVQKTLLQSVPGTLQNSDEKVLWRAPLDFQNYHFCSWDPILNNAYHLIRIDLDVHLSFIRILFLVKPLS